MPFPGGLTETANGLLLLSVLAAILYGYMAQWPASWRRTAVKTLSVALLGVLAWSAGGPLLLALALMASASGDAALAAEEERWFLPGLVAFLIAHLIYIALFATGSQGIGILAAETMRGIWALLIVIAAGALLAKLVPAVPVAMRAPVVVYALAIAAMGGLGGDSSGLWCSHRRDAVHCLGRHPRGAQISDGGDLASCEVDGLRGLGALLRCAGDNNAGYPAVGSQFGAAISNAPKSNPGATVQPTSVHAPRLLARCHQLAGTTCCGRWSASSSGPRTSSRCPAPSGSAISRLSGAPA
jgi:uncharacterized membrane protein YhhN